jgi:hypothetical protein
MTLGGWIFMSASVTFVLALVSFCYYRVLRIDPAQDATHRSDGERENPPPSQ